MITPTIAQSYMYILPGGLLKVKLFPPPISRDIGKINLPVLKHTEAWMVSISN